MRTVRRCGFSLLELIAVLSILGVLIGLLLPAVSSARDAALRTSCRNNMRQIGAGLHLFHGTHHQLPTLPAANLPPSDPNRVLGWMAVLTPHLDREDVYRLGLAACAEDWNPLHAPPHVGMQAVIRVYVCPSDSRWRAPVRDQFGVTSTYTSYIGILGSAPPGAGRGLPGVLGGEGPAFAQVTDGLSNTLMVGERPPPASLQAGWWYPRFNGHGQGLRGPNNGIVLGAAVTLGPDPCQISGRPFGPGRTDNPCDRFHLWSLHQGGANFLFCDGSVRYLQYGSDQLLFALASMNGGEVTE